MTEIILLLQLCSTLAMVGLIWFVQVVHYPLFDKVGRGGFSGYEQAHQQRTTRVVMPLMLTEACTALLLLWWRPASVATEQAICGVLLVVVLWTSTFFWQVPAHGRLARSFDPLTHRRLVQSNWLRTIAWSARGMLVCWMCWQAMTADRQADPMASSAGAPGVQSLVHAPADAFYLK